MASISVGDFTKVISVTLRELFEKHDLVLKNVTTVVIRFTMRGQSFFLSLCIYPDHGMALEYSHTLVIWRKSPAKYRRDRKRFTNYATAQNNSHQGAHFDNYQYNEYMDIINDNCAQVCEYSINSQFHFNDNVTINPSLNSI